MDKLNHSFNSSTIFFGGASFFVQYKDALKPIYLMALIKMLHNKSFRFGLPFEIIENFSLMSVMEFYLNRSKLNPLQQLDFKHKFTEQVDQILSKVLSDHSLYNLCPFLSTAKLVSVMKDQNFNIPIFVYNETYDEGIAKDVSALSNSPIFIYGPIEEVITKIPNNSTMIFSNIERIVETIKAAPRKMVLNLLLTSDYHYNFKSNLEYKYNLSEIITREFKPFIKASNINVFNKVEIINNILALFK